MKIYRTKEHIIFVKKIQYVEVSTDGNRVGIFFGEARGILLLDKEALDFLMYMDMLVPNIT